MDGTNWINESVDINNIVCINEETSNSSKSLFRPHSMRTVDPDPLCRFLPADQGEFFEEGLVVWIPFACPVKMTGLTVIGGENGTSPRKVNLFANLPDPSSVLEVQPSQSLDLVPDDFCGAVEYPLRVTKFSQVNCLTLQFPEIREIQLSWIGIKGIASGDARKAVVTVYESRANLADHQEAREKSFPTSRPLQ